MAQIDDLVRRKRKIDAIKAAREAYAMDLKSAKEFVERRERDLGLRAPKRERSGEKKKLFGIFG